MKNHKLSIGIAGLALVFFFGLTSYIIVSQTFTSKDMQLLVESLKQSTSEDALQMYKDMQANSWKNITYIFAALSSLAFAAGGFIFGKQINVNRVDQLETETKIKNSTIEEKNTLLKKTASISNELIHSVHEIAGKSDSKGYLGEGITAKGNPLSVNEIKGKSIELNALVQEIKANLEKK